MPAERCEREACVREALDSHPEIAEARAHVEKAAAAVRLAKYELIPDVEAFARYSFQNNVPFLAGRFGTVGIRASYDLFDGGRKRAVVRERETQLAQARENLARISDEVELRVQTAYNKMERTRQMVAVSEELLALRAESRRVIAELLVKRRRPRLASEGVRRAGVRGAGGAPAIAARLRTSRGRNGCRHRATTPVSDSWSPKSRRGRFESLPCDLAVTD